MITKTTKPRDSRAKGSGSKNGTSRTSASRTSKPQKSMYEKWIEKYGVSDSKADLMMLNLMKKIHEDNNPNT